MIASSHILSQEGILTTFQIAKKVTAKDIKKLRDKMKLAHMDASQFQEIIKETVVADAERCAKNNKIPGLILENTNGIQANTEEEKRIIDLTYFASLISKTIAERNMNKYYSCYIINAIVNMLRLNDDDFENFHRQFGKFKSGEPPDDPDTPTF